MKTDAEVREYNRNYYRKKKKIISAQRRIKYWTDLDYRESIRQTSRRRYKQSARTKDRSLGYTVKRKDGIDLFTISYVSSIARKSKDTIRSWEKQGIIPVTAYTDRRGWRLYTSRQIDLLSYAFTQHRDRIWDKVIVKEYLHNNWNSSNTVKRRKK